MKPHFAILIKLLAQNKTEYNKKQTLLSNVRHQRNTRKALLKLPAAENSYKIHVKGLAEK